MKLTKALLKKIDTSVWTITSGAGFHGDFGPDTSEKNYSWIKAVHSNGRIEIIVNCMKGGNKNYPDGGNTRYKLDGDTYFRSFNRLGVEDSFYVGDKYATYQSFDQALVGELKRVEDKNAAVKAAGGYVSVPGTGFQITAARKNEMIVSLKKTGRASLTPSGFGHGNTFLTKVNRRSYGVKYASKEQKEFFGLNELYVMETEHD